MEWNLLRGILSPIGKSLIPIGLLLLKLPVKAGMTLFLGHDGDPCPTIGGDFPPFIPDADWEDVDTEGRPPHLKPPEFGDYLIVVDVSGVHFISISYCKCADCPDRHLQLLRAGLFPASTVNPSTVFTFRVLDDFLRDNVECGTSGMNYFNKLRRITSNMFPHFVPVSPDDLPSDRYSVLCRIVIGNCSGLPESGGC